MKPRLWTILLSIALTVNLRADLPELSLDMDDGTDDSASLTQTQLSDATLGMSEDTFGPASASAAQPVQPSSRRATELGQDFTRWERTSPATNRAGTVLTRTNRWLALETGGHYWHNGQWKPSREEIDIVPNGAVARRGPHKVAFAPQINSPISIEVLAPDNTRLKIRPLGLAYYDFHAETNILIAELKDSIGELVATNQVIYPDAFTDITADIRYTYRKSGLESDVILRQRPPLPEAFGLNPDTTRLLVLTEFIDAPTNASTIQHIRRGWRAATVTKVINFGKMKIGQGSAFSLGAAAPGNSGIPVQKHWTVMEGRKFLIEEVSFPRLVPSLRDLQAGMQSSAGAKTLLAKHAPSKDLRLPPALVRTPRRGVPQSSIQIASLPPAGHGLVLDFPLESTTDDLVLQGDTTYEVTGDVILGGTTIIEGGAVVKYDPGATLTLHTVQCKTGPYRPAIFTAVDDQTVGDSICAGEITGAFADRALTLEVGGDLQYLNIRYAREAIGCANNDYSASHCQIVHCDVGFHSETASFTNCNILMCQVTTNFYGSYFHGRVEHLTADQAGVLVADWDFNNDGKCVAGPSSAFALVNSLTASITNGYTSGLPYDAINCDHVWDSPGRDGIFQTAGAGSCYLADNSTCRGAGTPGIQPALAAALKNKTTWPPIIYSNVTISGAQTLAPQAQRETGLPDLGYAYDPLDYALGHVTVTGSLTFAPGTAVGWFDSVGDSFGVSLPSDSQMTLKGTVTAPCWFVRYDTVQEAANGLWSPNWFVAGGGIVVGDWMGDPPLQLNAHFTKWSACGAGVCHLQNDWIDECPYAWVGLRDCEVYNGNLGGNGNTAGGYGAANSLFSRVQLGFCNSSCALQNCLLWNGYLALVYSAGDRPAWTVKDTAFDSCGIAIGDEFGSYRTFDHNAYVIGQPSLPSTTLDTDQTVTAFNWQPSLLGKYYLPSDSPLKDAGSAAAGSVGLYHYTTQTDQTKEENSTVDIGLHYVALDASGNPIDTDGDGLPDYLEDSNGDGDYSGGDLSSWTDPSTDGTGMSDGWEMKYFGRIGVDPNGDLDGDGVNNLGEYLGGTDPNKIVFAASLPTGRLATNTVSGTFEVQQGVPAQMAVLVNPVGTSGARWTAYTSGFTVALPHADGQYDVWVGLRGSAGDDSQQTWNVTRITRDTTPPMIVVTNPAPGLTARPMIQLRGYSPEPLASVRYDLANGAGTWTGQQGFVTEQYFDTNTFSLTTNWFECPDLELAPGANTIALRLTDLAGNVALTNLVYTFDTNGDVTPPAITIYWPQDGARIGSTDFTLRGLLDDPTAQVAVVVTDGGGPVTNVQALVERDGLFWAEGLPVPDGASTVTLTATDAAGNVATTSLIVNKSALGLTISDLQDAQLTASHTAVCGTIDASGYKVWVNGVEAVIDGSVWTASGVPLPEGGTALLQAKAIPDSDNGGSGSGGSGGRASSYTDPGNPASADATVAEWQKDEPPKVLIMADFYQWQFDASWPYETSHGLIDQQLVRDEDGHYKYTNVIDGSLGHVESVTTSWWAARAWGEEPGPEGLWTNKTTSAEGTTETCGSDAQPPLPSFSHREDSEVSSYPPAGHEAKERYNTQTFLQLRTGGKATSSRKNLFTITAIAWELRGGISGYLVNIDPTNLAVGDLGTLGSDGLLHVLLPDNSQLDATVWVKGSAPPKAYFFEKPNAGKHKLFILANDIPLAEDKVRPLAKFCVGQYMGFSPFWAPPVPGVAKIDVQWSFDGTLVNSNWQHQRWVADPPPSIGHYDYYGSVNYTKNPLLLTNESTHAWWVSGGFEVPAEYVASLQENLTFANGQAATNSRTGRFSMSRPKALITQRAEAGTPAIMWLDSWRILPPALTHQGRISVGLMPAVNYMSYLVRVISPRFAGEAKFTQLCSRNTSGLLGDHSCTNNLDNVDPYSGTWPIWANPDPTGNIGISSLCDAPEAAGYGSIHMNDTFTDYVMFKPDQAGSIFVPLGKCIWTDSGGALYPSDDISPNSVSGPTDIDASYEWPIWLDVHVNGIY